MVGKSSCANTNLSCSRPFFSSFFLLGSGLSLARTHTHTDTHNSLLTVSFYHSFSPASTDLYFQELGRSELHPYKRRKRKKEREGEETKGFPVVVVVVVEVEVVRRQVESGKKRRNGRFSSLCR